MKTLLRVLLLIGVAGSAYAQTQKTRAALYTEVDTLFASGTAITAVQLRTGLKDIVASAQNISTDGTALTAAAIGTTLQAHSAALDTFASNGSAYYLSRSNQTGTQLAATISDFAAAAAAAAPVTSVASRTGAITLTKTDVGLANVDNTSDVNKPVSTAQAAANAVVLASAASDATTKANAAQAASQPLATVLTNTTAAFTTAQESKLAGIAPGAQTGTVTSASVTTANGVSATVATATTTPAFTFTLGAITPSTVNGVTLSGTSTPTLAVTGTSAISGTNTGDQTITLTGDITGSGTGSFATTLATVNSNVGSFTNASLTVNAKGLVTAASNGTAPVTNITGTANQITVTGTTTPTLSLPATITGLTSVTSTGFTGALTGNASTATTLATSRIIGGSSFNGSANVTSFPAPGAIGGTTPASATFTDVTITGTTGEVINGSVAGAGSYTAYKNNGTNLGFVGSDATVSGTATDFAIGSLGTGAKTYIRAGAGVAAAYFDGGGSPSMTVLGNANAPAFIASGSGFSGSGASITGLTQSQISGLTTTSTPTFSNVTITNSTLTYAGTTTIDFSGDGFKTITLTGNITFATSNLAAGKPVTVIIVGDTSTRTFSFPAWKFVGAAAPASLAANKVATLTLFSRSTTDANVIAAYAAEP